MVEIYICNSKQFSWRKSGDQSIKIVLKKFRAGYPSNKKIDEIKTNTNLNNQLLVYEGKLKSVRILYSKKREHVLVLLNYKYTTINLKPLSTKTKTKINKKKKKIISTRSDLENSIVPYRMEYHIEYIIFHRFTMPKKMLLHLLNPLLHQNILPL